jgi:adenylate cyclase
MAADEAARAFALPVGTLKERLKARTERSFAAEEAAGRRLALKGRSVALVAVAALVAVLAPYPQFLYYDALIALFILLGFTYYWLQLGGRRQGWHDYAFTAFDCILLAFTLLYPNPLAAFDYPPQVALRYGNFIYFYILLAGVTIGFQPRKVLWCGLMGALAWSAGVAWLALLPGSLVTLPEAGTFGASVAALATPTYIDLGSVMQDVVVFLVVSALLALVVARSRRLVERQMLLERQRSNLARYFPPATVDRLANQDQAMAQIREQRAAVLFFDLVGFTHWAERHSPAEVIRMLRDIHARVESIVFAHDGTLDKFIGDGAMATFGTPDPGQRDATNAIACAVEIVDTFKRWNSERRRVGQEIVDISVGLHYGTVVVGSIGTDRRMEFAVLGDTVNVASRLEALTRELECDAAISDAVAAAARRETGPEAAELLGKFREGGRWELRGRDQSVEVLAYG